MIEMVRGECVVNLVDLHQIIGGRVLEVVSEIAAGMDVGGRSTVKWAVFRKDKNMDKANLSKILKSLEEGGLICREVDKRGNVLDGWDCVWVNPAVIRHGWARKDFKDNQIKGFLARRGSLSYAKSRTPGEATHEEAD